MEIEQTSDAHYQKGFNEGYIVAKHLPNLSDSLAQVKNEAPRMEGFRDGRRQLVLDQIRERHPISLKENHRPSDPSKTKENSKDRDMDME